MWRSTAHGHKLSTLYHDLFGRKHKLPLMTTKGGDMGGMGAWSLLHCAEVWGSELICPDCFWSWISCRLGLCGENFGWLCGLGRVEESLLECALIADLSFGFRIPHGLRSRASDGVNLFRVGGCESVILRESGWLCLSVHLQNPWAFQMICASVSQQVNNLPLKFQNDGKNYTRTELIGLLKLWTLKESGFTNSIITLHVPVYNIIIIVLTLSTILGSVPDGVGPSLPTHQLLTPHHSP